MRHMRFHMAFTSCGLNIRLIESKMPPVKFRSFTFILLTRAYRMHQMIPECGHKVIRNTRSNDSFSEHCCVERGMRLRQQQVENPKCTLEP